MLHTGTMTASDASQPAQQPSSPPEVREADRICERLQAVQQETSRIVFGQKQVIRQTLATILAGGHALLVGAPGLGKTLLVTTLGTVLGLDSRRVQFTPDLMPSDITGSEILDEDASGHRSFRFVPGPVFCQLLMADEINRASPRTQSALLQAMQEHRVSVAGTEYPLPRPFHVLATQNPMEQEGTYPLPEAQLDRFMLQIPLSFPDEAAERQMLLATTGAQTEQPQTLMDATSLLEAQALVRRIPVGEKVLDAILNLVRNARPETTQDATLREQIAWGPGPRAAQTLMLATRARALLDGRLSPSLDDVAALAQPVLAHRMALTFAARAEGVQIQDVISRLLQQLG
ncbi:MoxR family transcriptional regulator [Acetobacter pasteurianus NBRC 101655]|uniref:Transcriptional regulator MoxR n=4 Tax=Acetobacter pasteurianus TaxID=438 RepID=C7JGB4_ACEP3|nr:MoxR family ATPase [Acetobacter pasteurianus]BAU38003.1 MoxR family transcriptional regulator [Acetobacter pasteurianus NBRC 101655]BAH99123.1 transcriptional regulator MoxR [Acetobacter pasteurianus IFO 3283-01]BAI02174.1 transcriptional regulator MoxR [Acetobacter pasteurianus IFO 3283-03]BAI05222.1 transcriptional regulator MoxR [Acetobacter pasteurianus IFO 3283-07]BAI08269.1 transcriptional regulator MoxR [Acetobacter pasteurianus IFO 3283-22]